MRVTLGAVLFGLVLACASCGPSPATPAPAPTGTLVIVIRQGAERVPFQPKVDRIRRANEQIAAILGHSIQIELDGSLLPQDHDGAQEVMARLLETVAQDLDTLRRHEPSTLAYAGEKFERLVVRYSPADAARRGRQRAELDRATKTIDVALGESRWQALDRGDLAREIVRAYDRDHESKPVPGEVLGSVDTRDVRRKLGAARAGDVEARKQLISSTFGSFSTTYHHHQAEVESAAAGSPFRRAEADFAAWINETLPSMTVEERAHIAQGLFVFDFRKNGERDAWSSSAFPGIDKMAFGFAQADAWVAAGYPARVRVYDDVLNPARVDLKHGDFRIQGEGSHDPPFFRWALAAPAREDAFVKALLQRRDPRFVLGAFYNAHSALRDEASYLRFLRRFESSAPHWRTGADVHRAVIYRPSTEVLEEARRHWRELPIARGHALFYFARHAEGSYHPEVDWPDMLQDQKPDDAALKDMLALGWHAYELVPVTWRQVQRSSGRLGIIEAKALELLSNDVHAAPGHKDVAGVLADIGRQDCEDDEKAEVAALRQWAEAQIPSHPGQGLSQILEATDPKECKPKKRVAPPVARRPIGPPKPPKPKWKEGDPLPPKDPFDGSRP